ncbi:MAG: alpha/beta hydrolase [Gammaproteobacteria bacterium]|nr:alpha/beta hydrolase [Gammaproteobacteria bacterium]
MVFKILFTTATLLILLSACSSPKHQPISTLTLIPSLSDDIAIMSDGYQLPLNRYIAEKPKATIIALHGFNDYRNAFTPLCHYLSNNNINCYTYDQRGFGETKHRGLWPKKGALQNDLITMTQLIKEKHPKLPLYVIGESMGGAVIMTAFADKQVTHVEGIGLLAPAVWARHTQPWYQQLALWITVRIAPGWKPTGKGFEKIVSDNNEMLKELSKDPLVIKGTRIDTIYGLTNLMDQALESAKTLSEKGVIFYGRKDELITKKPTCEMLGNITSNENNLSNNWRFVLYEEGYHMLSRDLQAETVYQDLITWINNTTQSLSEELSLSNGQWRTQYCDA